MKASESSGARVLERNFSHLHVAEIASSGYGYPNSSPAMLISNAVKDHVFLQYRIIGKRFFSRFERMNVSEVYESQKGFAKTSEIGPVAKTTRRDCHDLATRPCETGGQPHEGGIEIGGFYSGRLQVHPACGRLSIDLLVRRIEDHMGEAVPSHPKEAVVKLGRRRGDEVLMTHRPLEGNAYSGHTTADTTPSSSPDVA